MLSGTNNLTKFNGRNQLIWMALAFQAGAVNSGAFMACHRFVTHTTGFATQFGAEFASGNLWSAWGMLTVPFFFMAGSMFSAVFVDRRISHNLKPNYELLIFVVGLLLIAVACAGASGSLGKFGGTDDAFSDYLFLAILSLAMGIQNASITSASGAVIRTTHLTGITTDLGIGLVRILSPGSLRQQRPEEIHKALIRSSLIFAFVLGSTLAAFIFLKTQFWGFLLPAGTSLLLLIFARRSGRKDIEA